MSKGAKMETDMKNKYHPIAGGRNYDYTVGRGKGRLARSLGPWIRYNIWPQFSGSSLMRHGIESTLKY